MCLHGADAWNFLCGDGGACPSGDIWEKKLTFPVYKNILLDIKDMREK